LRFGGRIDRTTEDLEVVLPLAVEVEPVVQRSLLLLLLYAIGS
jgi:hypothetical protein